MQDDRRTMAGVRIRPARIMALWVIVAVAASAVMTCVPGGMQMLASQTPSCGSMNDEQPCVASDVPTDCCTHHELSVTVAKADLLKSPLHHVSPWLSSIGPAVIVPATLAIITAESPPELTSTLGRPTYIVLSTLRV